MQAVSQSGVEETLKEMMNLMETTILTKLFAVLEFVLSIVTQHDEESDHSCYQEGHIGNNYVTFMNRSSEQLSQFVIDKGWVNRICEVEWVTVTVNKIY